MDEKLLNLIKQLNDDRSKLSALFSLYNSSLLVAEENRASLGEFYDQMIDFKNDLNSITTLIGRAKKTERAEEFSKNKGKINSINRNVNSVKNDFNSACQNYRMALKDCGSLKTEYKHEVSELCKEFKSLVGEETDPALIKGYKQQVRVIKAIFDKIEMLISDYNVKKNKVEQDNEKFAELTNSVDMMINSLIAIA